MKILVSISAAPVDNEEQVPQPFPSALVKLREAHDLYMVAVSIVVRAQKDAYKRRANLLLKSLRLEKQGFALMQKNISHLARLISGDEFTDADGAKWLTQFGDNEIEWVLAHGFKHVQEEGLDELLHKIPVEAYVHPYGWAIVGVEDKVLLTYRLRS